MRTNSKPGQNYNPDLPPHLIQQAEQRRKLARKKARQDRLMAVVCFLVGLAFLAAGLVSLADSYRYTQTYLSTHSQVVEMKYISNQQCAVVQFQLEDGNGRIIKALTDRCGKTGSGVKLGENLKIFYQPQNLAKVYSDDFGQRWLGPGFLALFGGLVLIVSFIPDQRRSLG